MGLTIFFLALAGICNAFMDTIRDHYYISILPRTRWWESKNWQDKYVNYPYTEKVKWYYTVFPFYNAWHTFKYAMIACFVLAIVSYTPHVWWGDALILSPVFSVYFLLFYKYILLKRYER
jgi:hypothetical protein